MVKNCSTRPGCTEAYKYIKSGQRRLCVGKTDLEIKFGDIKQSFAAGLKALMLGTDPVMFECFSYHLQQHLRTQKTDTHTHTPFHINTIVKTLNVVVLTP